MSNCHPTTADGLERFLRARYPGTSPCSQAPPWALLVARPCAGGHCYTTQPSGLQSGFRLTFDCRARDLHGHDTRGADLAREVLARLRARTRLLFPHVAGLVRHHLRLGFLVHSCSSLRVRTPRM